MRGLKAPPRSSFAPAALTARAAAKICSRFSTAHGPAMITHSRAPIAAPPTFTTVCAWWNSRDASL